MLYTNYILYNIFLKVLVRYAIPNNNMCLRGRNGGESECCLMPNE